MIDGEENAALVNALQRHAYMVVQKSIAEGFGLTVAEAMWKGRPVVASRIGGIQDQVEDGRTGVLLDDPKDLEAYGAAVLDLLENPARAAEIGAAARESVRDSFLGARSLVSYWKLVTALIKD
jgi:trehalose synthase